jgi:hypothetical protein
MCAICTMAIAYCDCMSEALYFWPNKKNISENSLIVIDAYGASQELLTKPNCKAYLISGSEKIKLKLLQTCFGQFNLTQVILKPEINLTIGKKYELIVEGVGKVDHLLDKYNDATGKFEKIIWEVTAGKDLEAPTWINIPVYKNDTWIEYGCGPAVAVNFSFGASDISEYLVKAKVKDLEDNTETIYYLKAEDNIISIGHSMCLGEFYLEKGTGFEVEFGLMDASGNEIACKGGPLKFKRPYPKYK